MTGEQEQHRKWANGQRSLGTGKIGKQCGKPLFSPAVFDSSLIVRLTAKNGGFFLGNGNAKTIVIIILIDYMILMLSWDLSLFGPAGRRTG
jgi:hypothetical protein